MIEYILSGFEVFAGGLQISQQRKKDKSEALSALLDALRSTRKHIRNTRAGEFGDLESDLLSQKWSKAAALIRPFDQNFANVLENKSHYWSDPNEFRRDVQEGRIIFSYRFRLDEVEKEIISIQRRYNNL